MLTHRHIHGRASKYGHTMLLTHHKVSQARTSSLALICVPMLTCGEAKGSAKSCPATDPGDGKHELRRPERRSGSDRAGQERAYRLSPGWTGLLVARIERRRACRRRARRRARQTAIRFQPACSYRHPLASCVGASARHDRLRLRRPHTLWRLH